jgi:hypothetical protein
MILSEEVVLCFYVQSIVNSCRSVKNKILNVYSENTKDYERVGYTPIEAKEIFTHNLKMLKFDIEDVYEFVTSLPIVYRTRGLEVTQANNDQVYIADWAFLKETFVGYMKKIAKHLKIYYENIGKFYINSTTPTDSDVIEIDGKIYTFKEIDNNFNLAINYLYDVSPLVYYDKFRDTLR